jgi:hypothetical protein
LLSPTGPCLLILFNVPLALELLMMVSAPVRVRIVLLLLASALGLAFMTGCSAGWGDAKPALSVVGAPAQAVIVGQSATFTVAGTGTGPITYQWYVNGVAIPGATSSSYSTGATVSSQNGYVYTVVVSNAGGSVTSAPFVLTVNVPPAIITQPASQTVIAGQAGTFAVVATGTTPLSYQWYQGGAAIGGATSSTYTTPVTTALGSSAYTVVVTNVAGTVTSAAATLTVNPIVPTLTFLPIGSEISGGSAFTVSATSASSGPVTYSVTSGASYASVTPNGMVTITGAGAVTLSAYQAASGLYAAATASTTFTVAPEMPTLTFASIGSKIYGALPFTVSATSASNGAVTYSAPVGNSVASVAPGGAVTITGAGTVVLTASQAASSNGDYAATTTTTTLTVAAEAPTLTFASIGTETYGGANFTVSASSASNGTVTYSLPIGNSVASVTANGTVTIVGAGTVLLTASQAATTDYAAATATTTVTVAQAVPTLTFGAIGSETFGGNPFAVSASSASSGAITYSLVSGPASVTPSGTVTITGSGPVVVRASQAATANYAVATTTTSFTVAPEVPTLTFGAIGSETFGGPAFTATTTSASSGAVTYSVLDGPATVGSTTGVVTLTGAGTVVLAANQVASGNYAAAATATTTFTVAAEVPTLTFGPYPAQTVGVALALNATSASNGAITYAVTGGPGTATIAGSTLTPTAAGSISVTASQAATTNYAAASAIATFTVNSVPVATSLMGTPPTLLYGGSLSLIPVFSGGTAVIGTAGVGSSNIAVSAVSGTLYPAPPVTAATTYTLTVTGTGGNSVSTTYTITPTGNVTISAVTPPNQTMAPGPQAFSAIVTGGATNGVTWSATGGSITSGGAWTAPNTAGTYTITATSTDEPSVYASTTVTVTKPVITLQPISKNACSATSVTPSLTMAANYATSYQWYFNGNALSGATSPTFTLTGAVDADTGSYSCDATNGAGSVSTNVATLNVVTATPLTITAQPAAVNAFATQTATFSVGATGTGTLAYQWYTNSSASTTGGTLLNGATSSSYTTPVLTTAGSTYYYVTVTDPDCTGTTVTSSAAMLTSSTADQDVPPTIDVEPVGETTTVGATATFSVTASGSGTLSYQWYRVAYTKDQLSTPTAGVLITGATGSSYTVPTNMTTQANDGDNYYVVVTGSNGDTASSQIIYGSAVSSRANLAVGPGIQLQITAEPQTDYVPVGSVASFSVGATCTGCIPEYQWYWFPPNSTTAVPLSDGAVSSGLLTGSTVVGSATSSLSLGTVPVGASAGIFYVVVKSTSDGSTQNTGTNPLTSSTAGLFVGSLGSIGDTTPGEGLCNTSGELWTLNGFTGNTTDGAASGGTSTTSTESPKGVPSQDITNGTGTSGCMIEMTDDKGSESASVYWPTLISTANFSVSYTVTLSNVAAGTPADGFSMILADPSQGATTSMRGLAGEGLGASGIPGFVLGFDMFQNGNLQGYVSSANPPTPCSNPNGDLATPCDPTTVPYMAVGPGATALWENPWSFVNGALNTQYASESDPYSTPDYTQDEFVPTNATGAAHNYVVTVVNGTMTVTMDGYELFSGTVSLPPVAYLGFTASTGGDEEEVLISNLTATVSAP